MRTKKMAYLFLLMMAMAVNAGCFGVGTHDTQQDLYIQIIHDGIE